MTGLPDRLAWWPCGEKGLKGCEVIDEFQATRALASTIDRADKLGADATAIVGLLARSTWFNGEAAPEKISPSRTTNMRAVCLLNFIDFVLA